MAELLAELRATPFPSDSKRERPKIRAEGYIILQRPPPQEEHEILAAATALAEPGAVANAEAAFDIVDDHDIDSPFQKDGSAARVHEGDKVEKVSASDAARRRERRASTKTQLAVAKVRRHARIWALAHAIMREGDAQYASLYTAIAVTKQFEGSPHIDTENVAPFYGLGLGDYRGGFICVESEDGMGVYEVDTRARLAKVDGRRPHWVSPHEGERFSIIYYQTAGEVVPHRRSVFAVEQPKHEQRL